MQKLSILFDEFLTAVMNSKEIPNNSLDTVGMADDRALIWPLGGEDERLEEGNDCKTYQHWFILLRHCFTCHSQQMRVIPGMLGWRSMRRTEFVVGGGLSKKNAAVSSFKWKGVTWGLPQRKQKQKRIWPFTRHIYDRVKKNVANNCSCCPFRITFRQRWREKQNIILQDEKFCWRERGAGDIWCCWWIKERLHL